jgi:hypothetical protein
MGVDANVAEFLMGAVRRGASLKRFCSLGHQDLLVTTGQLKRLLKEHGFDVPNFDELFPWTKPSHFADSLYKILGAQETIAVDFSEYQGATIRHDLNVPIGPELREQFDTVLDGGTIEHVFNFPVAIKNAMEMVKVGGHFICQTGANNYCGHGLYQYSPELFFRIFTEENGYKLERLVLCEWHARRWYDVVDPAQIKKRVELVNGVHTAMLVQAKRIARAEIFKSTPQQSDYVTVWSRDKGQAERVDGPLKSKLRSILGPKGTSLFSYYMNILRHKRVRRQRARLRELSNTEAYKRIPRT